MVGAKILIFILAVLNQSHAEFQENCTTPDGRNGVCKSIRSCELLKLCRRRPNMTPAIRTFLESSHCGTATDGKPAVCCEINYQPTTTNLTTNPCYPEILSSTKFPSDCGRGDGAVRIVGGVRSPPTEFPWTILIEYETPRGLATFCGGTLISDQYVVTAAHCIKLSERLQSVCIPQSVRLGEYNIYTDPDCLRDSATVVNCKPSFISIPIEKQIAHENFDLHSPANGFDIALLKLQTPVTFSETVKPICLPGTTDAPPSFTTAGWGATETSYASNFKQKVELPHVPREHCQTFYENINVTLSHRHLCAGGQAGKDTCGGDSGGPLMAAAVDSTDTDRWTLFGIVSFGRGACGRSRVPGVYTQVNSHLNWIIQNID